MTESVGIEALARVLCRGQICSHRKQRPCEFHLAEAKILAKYLKEAGMKVVSE